MNITPIKTSIFREGQDLFSFLTKYLPPLLSGTIVVITSKIVALAQRRTVVARTEKEKENIIRAESDYAIKTPYAWLTIKDDDVMPSAGVDESNADGKIILLPKNCMRTASEIRHKLCRHYGIKNLGVLITDSRTLPLRAGTIGMALGYAGFRGIKDYRSKRDLFGRAFRITRVDLADSLAAAAVCTMGEGKECQPLAIITDAPVTFCVRSPKRELHIPIHDDMYAPLFYRALQHKKQPVKKIT
ncbi:coenzyme F420-0:L-glutamate ligase [Candidatus Uhrbacteria bacterium]|nr:coenzyme F420-0:L-glutamate ligase [Candidatus Uhrbacteria bacterium]